MSASQVDVEPFFKVISCIRHLRFEGLTIATGQVDQSCRSRVAKTRVCAQRLCLCASFSRNVVGHGRVLCSTATSVGGASTPIHDFPICLTNRLQMTAKALPRLDDDERLIPILNHLSIGFASNITSEWTGSTTADGETITADMIPQLSEQSFPLCMRSMQSVLKSDRHLKYEGRQQYGLFLKACLARQVYLVGPTDKDDRESVCQSKSR